MIGWYITLIAEDLFLRHFTNHHVAKNSSMVTRVMVIPSTDVLGDVGVTARILARM